MIFKPHEPIVEPLIGARFARTMLRIGDLPRSIRFYTGILGMTLVSQEQHPSSRCTIAWVGYGHPSDQSVLELTHHWDSDTYDHGSAYGHVTVEVQSLDRACAYLRSIGANFLRPPGPTRHPAAGSFHAASFAVIEDPDGYRIELIQARVHPPGRTSSR